MVNPYVLCLGWTLVHFLWQGAAIALLLWIGLKLSAKKEARLRYALSCLALILMAVCPVVTFIHEVAVHNLDMLRPLVIMKVYEVSASPSAYSTQVETFSLEPYLQPFVVVWLVGVIALSLRLIGGLLWIERLKHRFTLKAPQELQDRLTRLAGRLNIRRRVSLVVSERVETPMTVGVLRAIVILPMSVIAKLSPEQLEVIFLHELAHISRHDYLVNLIQSVLETVMFYHPAVWWISSRVRAEREHCCDDIVVRMVGESAFYAKTLTILEEHRQLSALAVSATGGPFMNRIRRILGFYTAPVKPSTAWATIALLVVMMFAMSSTIQADVKTTPKKKTTTNSKVTKSKKAKTSSKKTLPPKVILVKKQVAATSTKPVPEKAAIAGSPTQPTMEVAKTSAPAEVFTTSTAPNTLPEDDGVSVSFKKSEFSEAISQVCKFFHVKFVVRDGEYYPITLVLHGTNFLLSIKEICADAGATYKYEDGIYFFQQDTGQPEAGNGPRTELLKLREDVVLTRLEFQNAELAEALQLIFKQTGQKFTLGPGDYKKITMTLEGVKLSSAVKKITEAAIASFQMSPDGIIHVFPKK